MDQTEAEARNIEEVEKLMGDLNKEPGTKENPRKLAEVLLEELTVLRVRFYCAKHNLELVTAETRNYWDGPRLHSMGYIDLDDTPGWLLEGSDLRCPSKLPCQQGDSGVRVVLDTWTEEV